jgi:hypothetical protein
MATDGSLEPTPPGVIEHGTSKAGRWLRARRVRLAIWIAVIEGVVLVVSGGFTRWSVYAIATVVLALYVFWARKSDSDTVRQGSWVAAASQALAVGVVIVGSLILSVVHWVPLLVAAALAAIAFMFLLNDRR